MSANHPESHHSKPKLNFPAAQSASAPKVLRAVKLPGAKILTAANPNRPRAVMTDSGALKVLSPFQNEDEIPVAQAVPDNDEV